MLKPFKKFTFIKGDISDNAFIDKLFDEYKYFIELEYSYYKVDGKAPIYLTN